jgi:CPA1 family monovalent cation:H+ antiporter
VTASFVFITGGGALVGLAVGLIITHVIDRVDDSVIEIALTTIAAYGSFTLGDGLHVSGVIATVAAGMVCGNRSARRARSAATRTAVVSFWDYVAFALNSIVFLLIGFEVSLGALARFWREIGIAYLAVLAARALIILGGRLGWTVLGRERPGIASLPWSIVLVWGGVRGALSMVLALSLDANVAGRELIVTLTTGVVVLTLLLQGLTMAPLLRRVHVGVPNG